jgi:hypothetical protein
MQNTQTSSDLLALSAELLAQEGIVASPALVGTKLELRLKEGKVLEGHLPKEQSETLQPQRLK